MGLLTANKKIWLILSLFLSTLVLFFQNCAPSGPSIQEAQSQAETQAIQNAPFAYQIKMDQISYMSCTSTSEEDSHFSFRVGAYGNNFGVKLRSDFIEYANDHYDKPYDPEDPTNKDASAKQIATLLQKSPVNVGTYIQLAIRPNDTKYIASSTAQLTEVSVVPREEMEAPLSSLGFSTYLSENKDDYINYFANTHSVKRDITLSLNINKDTSSYLVAETYRQKLYENRAYLTMNFTEQITNDGDREYAKSPSAGKIYGEGYQFSFAQGEFTTPFKNENVDYTSTDVKRTISSVSSKNMETGQAAGTWTCHPFVIYKTQDQADCPMEESSNPTLASQIHRHLFREDWRINLTNRCVVEMSSSGSCYSGVSSNIAYNNEACIPANHATYPTCPHYVTVCLRN